MTIQNIQSDYGNATVAYTRKAMSTEESYRRILEQKLEQQDEVIQNGSTEEAIPLGGTAFTTDEWEEMLANFDATMDDLREQMRAEHAKRYEEQLKKASQLEAEMERARISGGVGGTSSFDMGVDFENSMGVEQLEQISLAGYSLNKHMETGIRYLVKDGDEGRGGRLLINSDEELAAMDALAETYLRDYPNLVSNKEVAQINAVLEVLGLMQRTPNGFFSVNRDGISYNDNFDSEKNWALLFEGEYYQNVFEFVKLHRVLGTNLSDYSLWDKYFEENEIQIQRIWSDQELEQGFLNN